jgi:hypothetical protein
MTAAFTISSYTQMNQNAQQTHSDNVQSIDLNKRTKLNVDTGNYKTIDLMPQPQPNRKKATELMLKEEPLKDPASDQPEQPLNTIVKRFHHTTSSFVARCYLFPLVGDGIERDHALLMVDVLRSVKQVLLWFATHEKSPSFEWTLIRAKSLDLVKKWKRSVILKAHEMTKNRAVDFREESRKMMDQFIEEFEEFVTFLNAQLGYYNKTKSLMSVDDYTLMRNKVHASSRAQSREKNPKIDIQEQGSRIARSRSTPHIYPDDQPNNSSTGKTHIQTVLAPSPDDSDTATIIPEVTSPVESIKTLHRHSNIRPRARTVEFEHENEPLSPTKLSKPQWDIKKLFDNLQELKQKYEEDINEKKEKQKMLINTIRRYSKDDPNTNYVKLASALDAVLPSAILPSAATDLSKLDTGNSVNVPVSAIDPKTLGTKSLSAEQNAALKRSHTINVPSKFVAPSLTLVIPDYVPPPIPKLESAKLRPSNSMDVIVKDKKTKAFSPSISAPNLVNKAQNEVMAAPGDGNHRFRKVALLEDIRHSFRTLFSRTDKKKLVKGVDFKSTKKYEGHEKCQVCEDRFSFGGGKVKCVQCDLIVHQKCRENADLGYFDCVET